MVTSEERCKYIRKAADACLRRIYPIHPLCQIAEALNIPDPPLAQACGVSAMQYGNYRRGREPFNPKYVEPLRNEIERIIAEGRRFVEAEPKSQSLYAPFIALLDTAEKQLTEVKCKVAQDA